jgi:electron transport complex protein RnfD
MNTAAELQPGARLSPVDAVLLALLPGTVALAVCFGAGVLVNLLFCLPVALLTEMFLRRLEGGATVSAGAQRGSLLIGLLLAMSLPPASPWWLAGAAPLIAIGVGRRLSNGHGGTLFNPAMLAYAALLLCFPREMSRWIAPEGASAVAPMGLLDAVQSALGMLPAATLDGFTMATPLGVLRQDTSHTLVELQQLQPQFGALSGRGWEWANAAFLTGGLWLAWRGTIDWRVPAGLLLGLGIPALLNDDGSSASGGPVLFHFFSGGTLLAAFFILTEPGSGARHPRVRLLSGALVGALVYFMRSGGGWPDGIAFAVLAANAVTPFADRFLGAIAGSASGAPVHRHTWQRHAPDAGRVLMLAVLLLVIDWRGNAAPGSADVTETLLAEMAEIGYTRQQSFTVQDPALLGLPAGRTAWRLQTNGGSAAIVLPLRAYEGYGGPIDLLLAVDERGRVLAVRVTAHSESPGFSDPLVAPGHPWLRAFEGRALADTRWALRHEGGDFDAFTGATVTPRAVVAALRNGLQYVSEHRPALLGTPPPTGTGN